MSGSFAGSKSLDDRRRRRIAKDETPPLGSAAQSEDQRPLPSRRPTGRFPLRRVVSRSPLKLAAVAAVAAGASCGLAALEHVPGIRSGEYGPGLAMLCSEQAGRIPQAVGGLLLLATGQLAWLIRWARARSLQDFRGGYQVWWWASIALLAGGAGLLTDAHLAFAATIAWLSGQSPFGSDALFRLGPGAVWLAILLPALQSDMRGCRTSRTLLFLAVGLWLVGSILLLAGDSAAGVLPAFSLGLPVASVASGLLLAGAVAIFSSLLFHARHVVYESVEPPAGPVRSKRATANQTKEAAPKAKRAAGRRSSRTKSDPVTDAPAILEPVTDSPAVAKAQPPVTAAGSTPPKPHFARKAEAKSLSKPTDAARAEAEAPRETAPNTRAARRETEEDWTARPEPTEKEGRQYRLDGPQDPLRGLSKRERRKLRKAMKGQDDAED